MKSNRMTFKMSRMKTHRRSTRMTEFDQIPSRVSAVSWVIENPAVFLGVGTFPYLCQISMPSLHTQIITKAITLRSSACVLRLSASL